MIVIKYKLTYISVAFRRAVNFIYLRHFEPANDVTTNIYFVLAYLIINNNTNMTPMTVVFSFIQWTMN